MIKKLILLGTALAMSFTFSLPAFSSSTMSWNFELYGNMNAEVTALSMANAQKDLEEGPYDPWEDPMERFEEMLSTQVFSRISRMIVEELFGDEEGDFQAGQYIFGNYVIDITSDGQFITVIMTDTLTGNQTIIQVPYYEYIEY